MNNNIITSVILLVGLALLNTGKILWERVAHKGIPKSKRHTKSTKANCTPATDGKYLIVNFGSEGLFCYDFKGKLIWEKDMGILNPGPYTDPGVEWGYAISPIFAVRPDAKGNIWQYSVFQNSALCYCF